MGQCAAAASSGTWRFPLTVAPFDATSSADILRPPLGTLAVGQNEHAFSSVRGADIGRSHARPFRIEPDFGQVSEYSSEPRKEAWDVLQEHVAGSNLANHPDDFSPESGTLPVDACSCAGNADVLAGEPADDDIDSTHEERQVNVFDASDPNRSRLHGRVFHPCQEDRRSVGVPLDVTQNSRACGSMNSDVQSADAGEQAERSEDGMSHT